MTLKIMQEVTEWTGFTRQPNHVYLMSGDRAYAYVKWGKGKPFYFKTFQRIDRRGRKFVEVAKNPWRFNLDLEIESEQPVKPSGQTWTVAGSKGNSYAVSLSGGSWSCSCPGYGFRNRCRHVDELRASIQQPG